MSNLRLNIVLGFLATASTAMPTQAQQPLLINELFFDPPGDDILAVNEVPVGQEYIELRGEPGQSLDGYYLIFLESENAAGNDNQPGNIDHVFDLAGKSVGTNGFLTLFPKNFEVLRPLSQVAPGTAIYQHAGAGVGWGSGGLSTIGADDQNGDGVIENGGFSALLIKKNNGITPRVNLPIDGNRSQGVQPDGTLDPATIAGWDILDTIGQLEPSEDEDGWSHAKVSFTAESIEQPSHITPGGQNVYTGIEPEYLLRLGSSTGDKTTDWIVGNITTDANSGWTSATHPLQGYRVSGPHIPFFNQYGELATGRNNSDQQQVGHHYLAPEGTIIQNTLGRPNWPVPDGDLNQNLLVEQDDLNTVLANWGQNKPQQLGYWLGGDPSGNGVVEQDDLNFVLANWGKTDANQGYTPGLGATASASTSGSAPASLRATALSASVGSSTLNADFVPAGGASQPANTVTTDLKVSTATDWLSNAVLIQLTQGTIYQHTFGSNTAAPNAALIAAFPELAFDTYLSGPNGAQASLAGGAINLGGGVTEQFTATLIDATWSTTGTADLGDLLLGRFTFSNDAFGTFAFRITAAGQDPLLITGSIVNGQFVIPEPAMLSLIGLAGIGLLRRRRSRDQLTTDH